MKKSAVIALAALSFAIVACNSKASLVVEEPAFSNSFNVVEESEITGEDLYSETVGSLENYADQDILASLRQTFDESYGQTMTVDPETKAIVPALYKTVRVEYQTLDQDNKPVTASALIVYPLFKQIKDVMLINHGTHIGFMLVPSKYTSIEGVMAATGALCIMPDYIGLGSSSKHPDLYLNEEVHGRTSIDALLTLFDYAKAKKLPLDSNFKTYILGYSQGGSVSLASLRRFQELDQATQNRLHLEKVLCGDGPYDLRLTFEEASASEINNEYMETEVVTLTKYVPDALLQHVTGMLVMMEEVIAGRF